jgi:hypothetical protein
MLTIQSEKSELAISNAKAFAFLNDLNNWQVLMPKEVTKWESTEKNCSFVLGGMATIGLKIQESIPSERILLQSEGKSPFPFTLEVGIVAVNENTCTVQINFEGDMNMMMRMMSEKPLTNFFNYLSHKMKSIS